MRCSRPCTIVLLLVLAAASAGAQPSAYIERWATGTLTTGERFESWRIRVVAPEGDEWVSSGIDGWLTGGATWYFRYAGGAPAGPPDPDLFASDPDLEFAYYYTSPELYPNTDVIDSPYMTADGIKEPTFVHLSGWWDMTWSPAGDYVVWQGTVLNPPPGAYGTIEFSYAMQSGTQEELTFVIPEPASAVLLLALAAAGSLPRRR